MTIGWKAMYWKNKEQPLGELACPACKLPGRFKLQTRMFFFQVMGIPIFPVSGKRKVYKCGYCTSTYRADKVDIDRSLATGTLIGGEPVKD